MQEKMAAGKRLVLQVLFAAVLTMCLAVPAKSDWVPGTATFYGGSDGSGTMGGACGYGNLYDQGYGINNAALSSVLFNDGASCGQCYLIMCDTTKSNMCNSGKAITISATNLCPANNALPNDNGGWCNPPRPHFDMSQPAWLNIGIYKAGIIPILYQQVKCWRSGGLRFTITGKNYFQLVLVTNMAGSGSIRGMWVKGTKTAWIQMSRNWGANWQCLAGLEGQALTFSITSTGWQTITFENVIPAGWKFGQTFPTWQQFDN